MTTKTKPTPTTLTLTIGAGFDTQGFRGSAWYVATEHEMLKSGGTARGPREYSESAWYRWVRRQVVAEMGWAYRFNWSDATLSQDGASSVTVTVTATRRRRR